MRAFSYFFTAPMMQRGATVAYKAPNHCTYKLRFEWLGMAILRELFGSLHEISMK